MESELEQHVIHQDDAIKAIAKAVRRSRSGLKDPHRPMGSFIFLGPVGRRQDATSASALAKFMFGERGRDHPDRHVRVHGEAQRLAASSARRRATSVTRRADSSPRRSAAGRYSVVLLDEIEKAHPDVFNMLLQIMEEGALTDSFGRHVDFRERDPDHDLEHRSRSCSRTQGGSDSRKSSGGHDARQGEDHVDARGGAVLPVRSS